MAARTDSRSNCRSNAACSRSCPCNRSSSGWIWGLVIATTREKDTCWVGCTCKEALLGGAVSVPSVASRSRSFGASCCWGMQGIEQVQVVKKHGRHAQHT